MKLALDAMGGDYAPQEIVLGGLDALNQYDFMEKLYLVGKRDAIEAVLKEAEKNQKIDYTKLEIVEASEVIEMDDHPATAYRRKKDASITVATRLVKEGTADAVVSAGRTGGQMVSALFGLGRIKGVNRPAIGCIIPTYEGGKLLVDTPHDFSFPSGHTIACFEASIVLLKNSKKMGIPALIIAIACSFSRLYLYVHYPTDVIASIILGTLFGILGYALARKCNLRNPFRKGKYQK